MEKSTFIDTRDGKVYETVKIGSQVWMAENLAYEAHGSKYYYNDKAYGQKYGRLYDWETAKKACPKGWHLPTKAEWDILTAAVGGEKTEGKHLKAASGWNSFNERSGNGLDSYGFSAMPGGNGYSDGGFDDVGNDGYWWSATEDLVFYAYYWIMYYYAASMGRGNDDETYLFSVRCLRD